MAQPAKFARSLFASVAIFGVVPFADACIQDGFAAERHLNGTVHSSIRTAVNHSKALGPTKDEVKTRLKRLRSFPRPDEPQWWNDVAGAHIRLGEYQEAVTALKSVLNRFANDYGVHANLGTAYHLMGDLVEAEKEISKDLELNPDGHDGDEAYHLALLQYLNASPEWQKRHLFVDEWTDVFFADPTPTGLNLERLAHRDIASRRRLAPDYRNRFYLAESPRQELGVAEILSLNQETPACFVMAGVLALKMMDGKTATTAFEKAIALKSPQSEQLQAWVRAISRINALASSDDYASAKQTTLLYSALLFVAYLLWKLYRGLANFV